MLAIPDRSSPVTKLADWVELSAVRSPDGRIGFSTLTSSYALSEEEQTDDIGEEDAGDEALIVAVQHEIDSRRKCVGPDYPFCVGGSGEYMQVSPDPTVAGAIYLSCLFLSHAYDRSIIPKAWAPTIDNAARDLFQACATLAAAGYVEGIAMSFGWPRPDGHAGRVGVSYSDHYEDQGLFHRLMDRVRGIAPGGDGFLPVLKTALT